VRTNALLFGAFVVAAVLAAITGLILTASVGQAAPSTGPEYLLPGFAAAFLGSTQFKRGRFNVWGTILAVYVLAIGVKGLQLAGAPFWLPDLFNGVALICAIGLAKLSGSWQGTRRRLPQVLFRRKGLPADAPGASEKV
jgi:ribose transport system permease protein